MVQEALVRINTAFVHLLNQLEACRTSFVYLLISSLESSAKDICFHFFYLFFFNQYIWCWVAIFESKESYMIRTHLKLGQQSINWSNFTGASWLLLGDCAEAANDFIQSEECVCVSQELFFLSLALSDALQGEQQVCFSWPANWHPWGERVLLWSKNTFLWVLEWMRWITWHINYWGYFILLQSLFLWDHQHRPVTVNNEFCIFLLLIFVSSTNHTSLVNNAGAFPLPLNKLRVLSKQKYNKNAKKWNGNKFLFLFLLLCFLCFWNIQPLIQGFSYAILVCSFLLKCLALRNIEKK